MAKYHELFFIHTIATTLLVVSLDCVWGEESSISQQPLRIKPFPTEMILPGPRRLEFTGPGEGFPPRPRDMKNVQIITSTEMPGQLSTELEMQIRESATKHPDVLQQLGARYAFIDITALERPKSDVRPKADIEEALVTFYSYTNNVAVEVFMRGLEVWAIETRPRYQPQESEEEINTAIAMARKDDRISAAVQGLEGDAIVMAPSSAVEQTPNHRTLYVTFSVESEEEPRYFAVVDLTVGKVWIAGPSVEIER